jgi:hypothetical protein
MRNLDAEYRWASAAFSAGRYDEALDRFEALKLEAPPFDCLSHHSIAIICEAGFSSLGVDNAKALQSYRVLASNSEQWGSIGNVGIAREGLNKSLDLC